MKRGFTLTDLMIIICILVTLSVVAVPCYKKYKDNQGVKDCSDHCVSIGYPAGGRSISKDTCACFQEIKVPRPKE